MINPLDSVFIIFWLMIVFGSVYWFYKSYKTSNDVEENHYELAIKCILENKKRQAIELLKEAIRKDSNNVDAYVKLGNILREEGAASNALRVHKDLALRAELSKEDRINVYKSISEDLIILKQEEKALSFLEQLFLLRPESVFAAREIVRIYENNEKFSEAAKIVKKSSKQVFPDRDLQLAMYKVIEGLKKVELGEEKDARIIYKEALKIYPKLEAAYILIGDSYWREQRKSEAIEKWLECARQIPEKAHFVFERLEKGWFETGEYYKLEDFYSSLFSKKQLNIKAIVALAKLRSKKGEHKSAISLIDEYLESIPNNQELSANKIMILQKTNDTAKLKKSISAFLETHILNTENNFICQSCGHVEDEPMGKCSNCGEWGKYI
jgi:lipopolysaccharide biosynthesis regulator YciM